MCGGGTHTREHAQLKGLRSLESCTTLVNIEMDFERLLIVNTKLYSIYYEFVCLFFDLFSQCYCKEIETQ